MINKIIIFSLIIFFSCSKQLNEDNQYVIDPDPFIRISSIENQRNLSGVNDIYINIKNFTRVWKIYLSIINNPAVSNQNRILLDTTSTIDQDIYQTYWDTKLYPNGGYELYAELFDSSNNRIFTTEFFKIINYKILNVENNLESPVNYQINDAFGTIFSKSLGLIKVENFFNDLILTSFSAGMPCGVSLSNSFIIKPDSSNIPIIINPDSSVFFLKIQNSQNSYIDSVTIKNNFLYERCNNISIPNDNRVYSVGYFSLNNGSETKIIANYGNTVDTNDVSFYNQSIRIDTLIIN
tara:strand:- start:1629 stop:2510 length:882 start_codon:yes stop_codon:yes gene_type:complete